MPVISDEDRREVEPSVSAATIAKLSFLTGTAGEQFRNQTLTVHVGGKKIVVHIDDDRRATVLSIAAG